MPSNGQSNRERLADLIVGDLPPEYEHIIEGLTPHEVETLLSIKNRLEAAEQWHGGELAQPTGQMPKFTRCIVF